MSAPTVLALRALAGASSPSLSGSIPLSLSLSLSRARALSLFSMRGYDSATHARVGKNRSKSREGREAPFSIKKKSKIESQPRSSESDKKSEKDFFFSFLFLFFFFFGLHQGQNPRPVAGSTPPSMYKKPGNSGNKGNGGKLTAQRRSSNRPSPPLCRRLCLRGGHPSRRPPRPPLSSG